MFFLTAQCQVSYQKKGQYNAKKHFLQFVPLSGQSNLAHRVDKHEGHLFGIYLENCDRGPTTCDVQ